MALQLVPSGGGTANADGIAILQTDLAAYGVTDAEMTNDATGLARAVWGFLKTVQAFDMSSLLGVTKPNTVTPTVTVTGFFDRSYTLSFQKYVNLTDSISGIVPLPTTGANSGNGGVALTDIFPNAVKVAAAEAVASSALVIATADLTAIDNGITHTPLDITSGQDNRGVLTSIYEMFNEQLALRDASTASAFTASSRGTVGLIQQIPAAYIDATNPTSDIDPADVAGGQIGLLSKTASVTIQTEEDLSNDTVDVRVVTA